MQGKLNLVQQTIPLVGLIGGLVLLGLGLFMVLGARRPDDWSPVRTPRARRPRRPRRLHRRRPPPRPRQPRRPLGTLGAFEPSGTARLNQPDI